MGARKINQSELADALGVTQGAVSGWCSGAIPKGDQLFSLARFFGVSMETMLTDEHAALGNVLCEEPPVYRVTDPRAKEAKAIAVEMERLAERLRASLAPESHGRREEAPEPVKRRVVYPAKKRQ